MRKIINKSIAIFLCILLTIGLVPMQSQNVGAVTHSTKKSTPKLNKSKATIYVGKTVQLKVKNSKIKKVVWKSSNKKIATVTKKGKVKGKKAGKATITAKVGKKKLKCKITVNAKRKEPIPKPEQSTTRPEQPTTYPDEYDDNGEDWIVEGTSNKVWIKKYVGEAINVVIPEKIQGKKVVGIRKRAFSDDIESIVIPSSFTQIDDSAFFECEGLKRVVIPNSVTSIGDYAFATTSLENIVIPNSVEYIGKYAFWQCFDLRRVTVPGNIKNWGDYVFSSCHGLTEVTILYGVTSLGNGAFRDCSSLTSVTIPNSVASIGDRTFEYCDNLTSIIIPDGITSIGNGAFSGCSSLTSVTIPDSVTSIDNYAFYDNNNLLTIKGHAGSYAQQFANEHGYKFEVIVNN